MNKQKETIKTAFLDSLPVMAGYIVLGIGFGILLEAQGYGWSWALLMSLTIYAGSMQYVAVDLLSTGASLLAAALMTLMVNLRHLFYGVSMLKTYKEMKIGKPYLIFALTDETFSIVCQKEIPETIEKNSYYLYLSLMNQCYWIAGSVIGGILGASLAFDSAGVEFSMTALFLVIVLEQWEKSKNHLSALVGFAISGICLLFFGADHFLIPSMIGITAVLLLLRSYLEKKMDGEKKRSIADPAAVSKGGES